MAWDENCGAFVDERWKLSIAMVASISKQTPMREAQETYSRVSTYHHSSRRRSIVCISLHASALPAKSSHIFLLAHIRTESRAHGSDYSPRRTHRFARDILQHFYVRIFDQRSWYRQPLGARAYPVERTFSSIRSKQDEG